MWYLKKSFDMTLTHPPLIIISLGFSSGGFGLTDSQFDLLTNFDQLKESVKLACSQNWQDIDISQFQGNYALHLTLTRSYQSASLSSYVISFPSLL